MWVPMTHRYDAIFCCGRIHVFGHSGSARQGTITGASSTFGVLPLRGSFAYSAISAAPYGAQCLISCVVLDQHPPKFVENYNQEGAHGSAGILALQGMCMYMCHIPCSTVSVHASMHAYAMAMLLISHSHMHECTAARHHMYHTAGLKCTMLQGSTLYMAYTVRNGLFCLTLKKLTQTWTPK